jgi:hypothetical protein
VGGLQECQTGNILATIGNTVVTLQQFCNIFQHDSECIFAHTKKSGGFCFQELLQRGVCEMLADLTAGALKVARIGEAAW